MKTSTYTGIHLGLTVLVAGLSLLFTSTFIQEAQIYSIAALVLGSLLSLVAYIIVANGLDRNPRGFMTYVMGGMTLKMMVGLACMLAIIFIKREMAMIFIVSFFVAYLIFTSLEIFALLRKNKRLPKA